VSIIKIYQLKLNIEITGIYSQNNMNIEVHDVAKCKVSEMSEQVGQVLTTGL
jgi:uncharacterized membrane protein YqiK